MRGREARGRPCFSTFLQRAYDQLTQRVALQNLPVVLAFDRAGLVGCRWRNPCGRTTWPSSAAFPTHRRWPVQADKRECRQLLSTAYAQKTARVAVRYPRGSGAGGTVAELRAAYGKGEVRRSGQRLLILAFGTLLYPPCRWPRP